MRHPGILSSLLLVLILSIGGAASACAQGLPGGASSLNETHGDWTVACMIVETTARCTMMQTYVSGENRQRVLSVQLAALDGDTAEGVLILPFGLKLDAGIRLDIDEGEAFGPLRFSTCLPAGCVVPLAFDVAMVAALRAGASLSVTAATNDTGQEIVFSISLAGFTSALDRIVELAPN